MGCIDLTTSTITGSITGEVIGADRLTIMTNYKDIIVRADNMANQISEILPIMSEINPNRK